MTKILITGVAGLFGTHFSKYLLDEGQDVIGIDDLSGGYLDFVDKRLIKNKKFHKINLLDQTALEKVIIKTQPEYVYHFAAYAAEGLSPFIRNFNYSNNLLASTNVINNCVKYNVKKFIFTSSMAVYGHEKAPFKESQTPNPADPYGIAKYATEMDIKQAYDQFGLKYNIVRPHNVVGIYQNIWDKYRNVIGIWIRQTLEGKPISVFNKGKQKRAFSDIKFYLEPLEKLMRDFDNETFNLGSDQEYEIGKAAEIVCRVGKKMGLSPKIEFLADRPEVKYAYSDHSKAKRMLNFKDETNLEKIVAEMFSWAVKEPKRKVKVMPYEIDKKMYSFWK